MMASSKNFLLDTHIFIWSLNNDERLKDPIRKILINPENNIYFSTASAWEVSIKAKLKKLPLKTSLKVVFDNNQFSFLNISLEHILETHKLPLHHKDPFDRMLIAQAKVEKLTLITADPKFRKYNIVLLEN